MLCAQRSGRHKNCRIGGLMIDNQLELQLQTVFYPGLRIDPFKHLSLEKRFYEQTSLITMYYIIASQNFATAAAWYGLVSKANGRARTIGSLSEQAENKLRIVLQCNSDVIFYPHVLQLSQVSKTIPVPACLGALMIWHSCYHTLKSGVRKYISLRINLCLYRCRK